MVVLVGFTPVVLGCLVIDKLEIESGGAPSQLTSTFIAHMLENRQLQKHIFDVLLPDYASRFRKLIGAVERMLHPLGKAPFPTYLENDANQVQDALQTGRRLKG